MIVELNISLLRSVHIYHLYAFISSVDTLRGEVWIDLLLLSMLLSIVLDTVVDRKPLSEGPVEAFCTAS